MLKSTILVPEVLYIFCSQDSIGLQCKSRKMGMAAMTSPKEKKKVQVRLFFMLIPYIKIQDPTSNRS